MPRVRAFPTGSLPSARSEHVQSGADAQGGDEDVDGPATPCLTPYSELQYLAVGAPASIYGMAMVRVTEDPTHPVSNIDGDGSPRDDVIGGSVLVALCSRVGEAGSTLGRANGLARLVPTLPDSPRVAPTIALMDLPGVDPSHTYVSVAGCCGPTPGSVVIALTSMATVNNHDEDGGGGGGGGSGGGGGGGGGANGISVSVGRRTSSSTATLHLLQWDNTALEGAPLRHVHIPLDFLPFCLEPMERVTHEHGFLLSGRTRIFFVPVAGLLTL